VEEAGTLDLRTRRKDQQVTTPQRIAGPSRKRRGRLLATLVVAGVLATATYAFTASNTVPASKAGDGSGAISGYTVSNVAYTLNATNPANLDSVAFTLDAAATVAKIKLVAAGSTWFNCTNPSGNNWTCATTGAAVAPADQLQVVATQ
jgi:hypothetical protein